jgi:membrane fusion protein (multidrug efflux system)
MSFRGVWRLGILMVLFLFLWGCSAKETPKSESQAHPQVQVSEERIVDAAEVVPTSISYNLTAVGGLRSPEEVTISPKKAGIIQKILVKEGDRVSKGQWIVQLDDVDARLQVERAEAKVKETEVSLETNRTTLSRYQKLLDSKVIPLQTYDDLNLKVQLDEAKVALARTELSLAKQSLLDHRIVSPIHGIVSLKIASLGEHVNVAPKDEILKIIQMDPLELEFYVPENWAGKVRPGSNIHFSVKAFSEERLTGNLRFISPAADPATRNVKMKAIVRNPQYRLKPGFFAEVTLQTGVNSNALLIPESALFSQEGKFLIFVIQNGTVSRREIETGVRMNGKVEVLKGLQKGERVVTAGHEQLNEGMKVTVSTRSQAPSTQ